MRSGVNGTYTPPPGVGDEVAGTPISPTDNNTFVADVAQTFNTPTPVAYGGTNAATEIAAANNLQVVSYNASQTLTQAQKGIAAANAGQAWEVIDRMAYSGSTGNYGNTTLSAYRKLKLSGSVRAVSSAATLVLRTGVGGVFAGGASDYYRQAVAGFNTTVLTNSSSTNGMVVANNARNGATDFVQFEIMLDEFNQSRQCNIRVSSFYYDATTGDSWNYDAKGYRADSTARDSLFLGFIGVNFLQGYFVLEGLRG